MPRRSVRTISPTATDRQENGDEAPGDDLQPIEATGDQESDRQASASKSRKTRKITSIQSNSKQTKGKKGKLRQIPEMPLDILYEIFGHLHPYDLLRVARTTKALRAILLRRSASDLTEPQYASLAFDSFCHFCAAPSIHSTFWECRVRVCKKCTQTHFMCREDILMSFRLIMENYKYALPCMPSGSVPAGKYRDLTLYPQVSAEALHDKIQSLGDDKDKISDLFKQEKAKTRSLRQARQHARLCEMWQLDCQSGRSRELQTLREKRLEAIIEKVRQLGYGPELEHYGSYSFAKHPLVNKPQALTDRVWSHIKQGIISLMEETRPKRLRRAHINAIHGRLALAEKVFDEFKATHPYNAILPNPAELYTLPECKALVLEHADDVILSVQDFKPIALQLPQFCEEWRMSAELELLRLMTPANSTQGLPTVHDRRQLELATTYFECRECEEPIAYPRILVHHCITSTLNIKFMSSPSDTDDDTTIMKKSRFLLHAQPWSLGVGVLVYTDKLPEAVRCILVACGLDPDTTSSQDMDEHDFRFECENCSSITEGALLMNWSMAVEHSVQHQAQNWKLASDAESARAKELDKDHETSRSYHDYLSEWHGFPSDLGCVHCKSENFPHGVLQDHLASKHGINLMTKDDYYVKLDAPPKKRPVRLLPEPSSALTS
ncbi:hypothetical protein HWV62_24764 [Athelia sp. TMB]|nr:hypothetical protein HWV62_24764 [Athelia sp. TMB]